MIEKALYRALKKLDVGGVFASVRGDDLPAVVYALVSSPRTVTITRQPQITESRFQVDCYGQSYSSVKAMAADIISALHNQIMLDNVPVQLVLLEDQRDQYEQSAEIHRQLLQFVVYHH
ncbi:hypothetical protein [Endozoicomonas sp. 2B-B]